MAKAKKPKRRARTLAKGAENRSIAGTDAVYGVVPSRAHLVAFLNSQGRALSRSELARIFGLKGSDRTALRRLLAALEADGSIERGGGRRVRTRGDLPGVAPIEIVAIDDHDGVRAIPVQWRQPEPPPAIVVSARPGSSKPKVGTRYLARLSVQGDGSYRATPMRRIDQAEGGAIGVLRTDKGGAILISANRSGPPKFDIATADKGGAKDGDLVAAELIAGRGPGRGFGAGPGRGGRSLARARVTKIVAPAGDPNFLTRIAIHVAGIPDSFPDEALDEAGAMVPLTDAEGQRVDRRDLGFVTIDGEDARDFDDAVFAQKIPVAGLENFFTTQPPVGARWHIAVAIADVAHYVRPGGALDTEAEKRGNSVYFPGFVVPMLPERLSNDLCSLRPNEDRPVLIAHMLIGARGELIQFAFERALIRSTARLTYSQVQDWWEKDGPAKLDLDKNAEWVAHLPALYGAYRALANGRRQRGALDLDLPEYRPVVRPNGTVAGIDINLRRDSHRLIEEFMITANIAAAKALEGAGTACMYRVHDRPDDERVGDLAKLARELGIKQTRGDTGRRESDDGDAKTATKARQKQSKIGHAKWFNGLLENARDDAERHLLSQLTLRAQAQAQYGPENIGHFGLGLTAYAHFTSPIRRYADLLVHRSLIGALNLGAGGLQQDERAATGEGLGDLGRRLGEAERRAAGAERDTFGRYVARFLENSRNRVFSARISGVAKYGLFVTIDDIGADGLVPMSRLGSERFRLEPAGHAMVGQASGVVYAIGGAVEVRLTEVNALTGSMLFDLQTVDKPRHGRNRRRPKR